LLNARSVMSKQVAVLKAAGDDDAHKYIETKKLASHIHDKMLKTKEDADAAKSVAQMLEHRYKAERHQSREKFRFKLSNIPGYIGSLRMLKPRLTAHHTIKHRLSKIAHSADRSVYRALAVTQSKAFLCADNAIMRLDLNTGTSHTIAGSKTSGHRNGVGRNAKFDVPNAVSARVVADADVVYVIDSGNNMVRRLLAKHTGYSAQVTSVIQSEGGVIPDFGKLNGIVFC